MATVTNATLIITPSSAASKVHVRVQGTVQFTTADVSTPHRLGIDLYVVQAPDDFPSDMDIVGGGLLYTFQWGTPSLQKPYMSITPQNVGEQAFDETRGGSLDYIE